MSDSSKRKRVGVMTSGGDCPGLNAAIRAIVNHASLSYDWEVLGIPHATEGLLTRQSIPLGVHAMNLRGIDLLLTMGGTILGSVNSGDPLPVADQIIEGYHDLGLDALIAICGDGSLAILHQIAQRGGWNFLAIPKTIDNDVALTDRSIGFDTAVNTVTDALNRIISTAASHNRIMVVEVMGRTTGHLALHAGIAGGADVILLPEIPYSITGICRHIDELRERWNRKFALVVVAEGAQEVNSPGFVATSPSHPSIGQYVAEQISHCSQVPLEVRVSVLGHVQRGGMPLALDRILAAALGNMAVDLIAQSKFDRMLAWQAGKAIAVPIPEVLALSPRPLEAKSFLIRTAHGLGTYVGDNPPLPDIDLSLCGESLVCEL